MSINGDMKTYKLQKKAKARSPSGAEKESWMEAGSIVAAIYKKNEMRTVSNERYLEATHTGLTHRKDIRAYIFRIVDGDSAIYLITDCNTESRMTNMLLKVVDTDV